MQLLDQFLVDQDVKPSSRALYRRTLRQFFHWLSAKKLDFSEVQQADLVAYKNEMLEKGLSALSVASYLCSVRRIYDWAAQQGLCVNIAQSLRSPKRLRQFRKYPLTADQSKKLAEYASIQSARDFALINLLLRTGLRTIEVARANLGDITFKGNKRVLLVHGKGRDEKDRFVILTAKCYEPLRLYLASRSEALQQSPIFVSESHNSTGKRLTTRSISQIVKRALQGIGLDAKEFTAHSLRHTAAVNILRAGGSVFDAQGVLRHQNPATTQLYTAMIEEEMRLEKSAEELLDGLF